MRFPSPGHCLVYLLLGLATSAHALEGVGYGRDEGEAKRRAAADLAESIQVRVHSVVESCTRVTNNRAEDCGSRVLQHSATDLPLLGLRYREIPGGSELAGAKALLDPQTAIPLYRDKLSELTQEFVAGAQALGQSNDRKMRYELFSRQMTTLRAIVDYRLVAIALGMQVAELPGSEAALEHESEALEQKVDTLRFAASVLLKGVSGRVLEVDPLLANGSKEATPLGNALADALLVEMADRTGPGLRISGEYRILDNGDVDVMLTIRDEMTRNLIGVRSVRLAPDAYTGYRAQPLAPDFEKLLRQGEAVSGDLRAELITTAGSHTLKFKSGEIVRLAARLNRPCYFYIVGHVVRENGQFSYLLPLHEGEESESFIQYVPADQVNHYIELGEFSVVPPFGTEHMEIIASTRMPKDALPSIRHDPASGYFVIQGSSGSAQAGLMVTRGLMPKPSQKDMVAEGTLTFTTSER